MSHQVLARKWRPHNFKEIIGQEHVSTALINALQNQRLHHAYLFTGTRGVGKTTIARILAKAINCESSQDYNPCGECPTCQAIDQGKFLDLIEVDAASRTRVEDTRDLLDNVQYAPNNAKYKVYIIDEVHMLSGHSFNALLKTLEEPPLHVKFLLATTDPQKIPVTVLSRCLQFNLKPLTPIQISQQMAYILNEEHISFSEPALRLLSKSADGSMRDGLSLLDQAIVYGNGEVGFDIVSQMLGTVAQQPLEKLLQGLAANNAAEVLNEVQVIAELSPNFSVLLEQLLDVLHQLAIIQVLPDRVHSLESPELLNELSALFSAEELQLYYQIALLGQKDLLLASNPKSGFEMLMLRMLAFKPLSQLNIESKPESNTRPVKQSPPPISIPHNIPSTVPVAAVVPSIKNHHEEEWSDIVKAMNLSGLTRELAHNCILESVNETVCQLILDPRQVRTPRLEEKLQSAVQKYYGKPLKLLLRSEAMTAETPAVKIQQERLNRQQEAVQAIEGDSNVQALKTNFDARIISGSIEPILNQENKER